MSEDMILEMLTLQYIQGQPAKTPLEYVQMYRRAKEDIQRAYEETTPNKRK